MNKYLVEKYIEFAYESMKKNKPNKSTSIRGQIATFGAAISSGSLLSAIAFFSNPPTKKSNNQSTEKKGKTTPVDTNVEHSDSSSNSDKAKEDAKATRIYLLDRIYDVVSENEPKKTLDEAESGTKSLLFNYVLGEIKENRESEVTEKVLSAAVAIKLALNLFE